MIETELVPIEKLRKSDFVRCAEGGLWVVERCDRGIGGVVVWPKPANDIAYKIWRARSLPLNHQVLVPPGVLVRVNVRSG